MPISNVVGIQNMGNSCFMAATLQMVAHTPEVREIVARHKCRSKGFCLPCLLRPLLDAIQNEQVDVFSPVQLYKYLPAFVRTYSVGDQFDAVEFFGCFVSQMQVSGSDIEPLFRADITEEVQCNCCGDTKSVNSRYLTIAIAIEGRKTVTELMHMFQHPKDEICLSCESSANCTNHFERMPQILTIQVAKGTNTSLIYENEIQLKDRLGESHTYSLYGAVIHIAHDTDSGHYLSLLRRENSWIEFDDSKVTIVEELNYREEGNFLFYQKVTQKNEDLKLRKSSRITKKETSSLRKVQQKNEDLKLRRSSRIAQEETSSSRKPRESQLERLIQIPPILPKSHSIPQPNNKLSIFVKGKRSPRMGTKSKSSWEKIMQESKYLKERSSRIAKKATSSSRKLTEECINEVDDVGLILISLKDDRSFHGDVASMKTAANMEDVAVNVSVGTAMDSSRRSERSDLMAAQVMQKCEDLKLRRSSRIAKIETSSSRKPRESQLERLIPIPSILPKSHSIPQPNNKLSIFVKGKRSPRMGTKSKSSWEKEEKLNRLETELKKKKEKERQNQGAIDKAVEENESLNLESSEAKGIQEYTESSGKALVLQDSGEANLDVSVPAKESHNGVHSPISSGALEVSNVVAIPISLSALIPTIGPASGVPVFLQEVDHDQLVEDVSKIIKKWNTPVRTASIGDTSCISSNELKQTLELLNKYLSVPIALAILDLDTKQHFEALSSFLLPHIKKKDKNKWMMLSMFIKSIDTTASQLSQAKRTWEQAEKLLQDHKLKLTAHSKYKSQLQTANTKLAEASRAEKQKERELKEVQKQLEVLRQNRIMAHSHLQHLLLQKDTADEASESLSKSEEEITKLQDEVTAVTEENRIAWEFLRDAFKDFNFDQ